MRRCSRSVLNPQHTFRCGRVCEIGSISLEPIKSATPQTGAHTGDPLSKADQHLAAVPRDLCDRSLLCGLGAGCTKCPKWLATRYADWRLERLGPETHVKIAKRLFRRTPGPHKEPKGPSPKSARKKRPKATPRDPTRIRGALPRPTGTLKGTPDGQFHKVFVFQS